MVPTLPAEPGSLELQGKAWAAPRKLTYVSQSRVRTGKTKAAAGSTPPARFQMEQPALRYVASKWLQIGALPLGEASRKVLTNPREAGSLVLLLSHSDVCLPCLF